MFEMEPLTEIKVNKREREGGEREGGREGGTEGEGGTGGGRERERGKGE